MEAFLSICFPLFKVEDKLVCETVTRMKFFVGLHHGFPGQQDCQMGFGTLMGDGVQSTSTEMKDT